MKKKLKSFCVANSNSEGTDYADSVFYGSSIVSSGPSFAANRVYVFSTYQDELIAVNVFAKIAAVLAESYVRLCLVFTSKQRISNHCCISDLTKDRFRYYVGCFSLHQESWIVFRSAAMPVTMTGHASAHCQPTAHSNLYTYAGQNITRRNPFASYVRLDIHQKI